MKTKAVLMGLASVLCLAACKKERTCVPPAPGDTPFTVVEGLELGMPLSDALLCPVFDTVIQVSTGTVIVNGTYCGIPVYYSLEVDSMDKVQEVQAKTSMSVDTGASRQVFDLIMQNNQTRYGVGKKIPDPLPQPYQGIDPTYSGYYYAWQICDGAMIEVFASSSYRNWCQDPGNLPYAGVPGDTLVRATMVWWYFR